MTGHVHHEECLARSIDTGSLCPICRAVLVLDFRGQPHTRKVHLTEIPTTAPIDGPSTVFAGAFQTLGQTHAVEHAVGKARAAPFEDRDAGAQEKMRKPDLKFESMRDQVDSIERCVLPTCGRTCG